MLSQIRFLFELFPMVKTHVSNSELTSWKLNKNAIPQKMVLQAQGIWFFFCFILSFFTAFPSWKTWYWVRISICTIRIRIDKNVSWSSVGVSMRFARTYTQQDVKVAIKFLSSKGKLWFSLLCLLFHFQEFYEFPQLDL